MTSERLAAYQESYDGTILILHAWEALEAQRDALKEQQMTDAKLFDVTAQFAHFFTAAFLVSQMGRWHYGLIVGVVGMVAFATFKEGYWDYHHETAAQRGSSLRDWAFYMLGTIVGALLRA
jgi:hypothetical protein